MIVSKERLRSTIQRRKKALSLAAIRQESRAIMKHISAWQPYRDAKAVLFYAPLRREVQIMELLEKALAGGKAVYLPLCEVKTGEMRAAVVKSVKELVRGPYGIWHPKRPRGRRPKSGKLDLLLVPGIAFDAKGKRLGRGGGHYDKFLSRLAGNAPKLGVAFSTQVVRKVPAQAHDIPMDFLVHPGGIVRCTGKKGTKKS